ncbi:hypothetical protein PQR39_35410 [Paraburkholderia sediminicola]|uniref:hypothetical protein n=1 Tax=Paraburkholderia sediminicola TaxID=458836 RepID=UPI0038BE0E70
MDKQMEKFVDAVVQNMCELPDRNSPDDEPSAMIANAQEMDGCIGRAFEHTGLTLAGEPFQFRVQPWMLACFGAEISADREERNHRFYEEATEAVQANGMTCSEAHQLVDYTYGRPIGELHQEIGGVMVTLAALCLASGVGMHEAAETELARVWTKVEQIRAKQAAKPKHSALPVAPPKFLFIAMDDDGAAHPIYCADQAAVKTAVRDSMFMPGDLDPDHLEQVNGVTAALLEDGTYRFEGDAPLHLYKLPEQVGDESHHSNLNGGSL